MSYDWQAVSGIQSKKYTCNFCGSLIASDRGYRERIGQRYIYICPHCGNPTYFKQDRDGLKQFPAPVIGNPVRISQGKILDLYNEARACTSVSAYTSAILVLRKLIMHIAVDKGASEGLSFIQYIEYLSDKGYVPPDGKEWVDIIRSKGNEANHEIVIMLSTDTEDLLTFTEMLLRFIYEFPKRIKKKPLPQKK